MWGGEFQVSEFLDVGSWAMGYRWRSFRRNIPEGSNSRYQTRYAQVGPSARARARRREREPPESEFRELTEMLSTIAAGSAGPTLPSATRVTNARPRARTHARAASDAPPARDAGMLHARALATHRCTCAPCRTTRPADAEPLRVPVQLVMLSPVRAFGSLE